MIASLIARYGAPLLLKAGAFVLAVLFLVVAYNIHVSRLEAAAREAGRQEAINGIANQNADFVAALKSRYADRQRCLARNDAGGVRFEWRQATGQCHRVGDRAPAD